jgi:hypothetical protein
MFEWKKKERRDVLTFFDRILTLHNFAKDLSKVIDKQRRIW